MVQYSFEKLEIWRLGIDIAREIYRITKKFPRDELWGLTSQMRRAATSVPLNIAEGSARRSKKEFTLFLRRAIGSLLELITATEISREEQYLSRGDYELLRALYEKEYFKVIAFEKGLAR